jgi:hypothetical protein
MRRRLVSRERHLLFVEQEMLGNPGPKIAIPMCSNPNDSRRSCVATAFSLLIEEVDAIAR